MEKPTDRFRRSLMNENNQFWMLLDIFVRHGTQNIYMEN